MPVSDQGLSRRERQIMDFLFRHGKASVAEVMEGLSDSPSYSAVRTILRVLERKGHVVHEEEGRAYLYRPTVAREVARLSALKHLLATFFDGSAEQVLTALLSLSRRKLTQADLDRLAEQVKRAKQQGR